MILWYILWKNTSGDDVVVVECMDTNSTLFSEARSDIDAKIGYRFNN